MPGKIKMGTLKKFQENLNKLKDGSSADKFIESCTKELAQRLLRKVILRTPVGDYSETYDLVDDGEQKFLVMSDKEGGTLRRGWTSIASLEVTKSGSLYKVTITNSTPYALIQWGI